MILIGDFNVGAIPLLLSYFVPGYIAIVLYRSLTSTKPKHDHTLFVACSISYVATTFAKVFLPDCITSIPEYLALATCILTALITVGYSKVFQCEPVVQFLCRVLHYDPHPTVLSSHIKLSHPGTTARVYMTGADYYVEGTLSNYSNDSDDPYISLCWYRFYELDTAQPYYECKNEDKYFVISMQNVQHIEVWPTVPDKNNH